MLHLHSWIFLKVRFVCNHRYLIISRYTITALIFKLDKALRFFMKVSSEIRYPTEIEEKCTPSIIGFQNRELHLYEQWQLTYIYCHIRNLPSKLRDH